MAKKAKAKNLFLVPEGDHNTTFMIAGVHYWQRLRQFMDACLDSKQGGSLQ